MNIKVTIGGSLLQRASARGGAVETISANIRRRLVTDLEQELQTLRQSGRAAAAEGDADAHRDALERAVRRIWGAAQ